MANRVEQGAGELGMRRCAGLGWGAHQQCVEAPSAQAALLVLVLVRTPAQASTPPHAELASALLNPIRHILLRRPPHLFRATVFLISDV